MQMLQMEPGKDNQNSDSSNSNSQSGNQMEQPMIPQAQVISGNASYDIASSWHIFSIFSWLFFICTLLYIIIGRNYFIPNGTAFYVDTHLLSFYMLIISIMGFTLMIKRTIYDKDANFMNNHFGEQSKYHSVGLLLGAAVLICLQIGNWGESSKSSSSRYSSGYDEDTFLLPIFSISLSFSAIGFLVLIYAYSKIENQCEWIDVLTIKKGTFSSLIGFFWFSLFFSAFRAGIYRKYQKPYYSPYSYNYNIDDPKVNAQEGMIIAFTIIVGVFNLGFSAYKNDLGPSVVNLIIYISNATYVYSPYFSKEQTSSGKEKSKDFEKSMSMIMVSISFILACYLIMKKLNSVMKV